MVLALSLAHPLFSGGGGGGKRNNIVYPLTSSSECSSPIIPSHRMFNAWILCAAASSGFLTEAPVYRPVGGRDSSGGGRVKKEEEDGKKAQRPGTTDREREVDIYIQNRHTLAEKDDGYCIRKCCKVVFVRQMINLFVVKNLILA